MHFPVKKGVLIDRVVARVPVDDASFTLHARQTLGVVGESGCGKSTLALCLLRLLEPTGGRICFKGTEIGAMQRAELKNLRREVQMVFQDPQSSLNPRKRVAEISPPVYASATCPAPTSNATCAVCSNRSG